MNVVYLLLIAPLTAQFMLPDVEFAQAIPDISDGVFPGETEVFVEFTTEVDFSLVGIADEREIPCSDILQVFEIEDTLNFAEIDLLFASCRLCPESNFSKFATFILPEILDKTVISSEENSRLLQNNIDLATSKFIRTIGSNNDPIEIDLLPEFSLLSVDKVDSGSFALIFNIPAQIIRGGESPELIVMDCADLFGDSFLFLAENCTLSFQDNLVIVQPTNYDESTFASVFFDIENPSFFAADEVYGLNSIVDTFIAVERPLLVSIEHTSAFTVELEFDQIMLENDIDQLECSQLFDLELIGQSSSVLLFDSREDLLCSLTWENNETVSTAVVTFLRTVPILDLSRVVMSDTNLFVKQNNVGFATVSNGLVLTPDFALYLVSFNAVAPTVLSNCDTDLEVEITQTSSIQTAVSYELSEDSTITVDGMTITIPENFCIAGATVQNCDLTSLDFSGISNPTQVTYNLEFTALALIAPGIQLDDFGSTNTITVIQNLNESNIPLVLKGADITNGVSLTRIDERSVAVILGDVFSCAGRSETSPISFQWEVIDDDDNVVSSKGGKTFKIVGNTLPIGNYTVRIVASTIFDIGLGDTTIMFSLTILRTAIVLVSASGIEQTSSLGDEFLILNATRSCNPNIVGANCQSSLGIIELDTSTDPRMLQEVDNGLQLFTLEWVCISCSIEENNVIFTNVTKDELLVEIPIANVRLANITESTLTFALRVTDGTDVFELIVEVTFIEPPADCVLPSVGIAPVDSLLSPNLPVTISGIPSFSENVSFIWEEENTVKENVLDIDGIIFTRSDLFIPAGSLVEGAKYKFRLIATPDCAINEPVQQSAIVSFEANIRPVSGTLNVDPLVGDVLTRFKLETNGWIETELNIPLEFAFETIIVPLDELPRVLEFDAIEMSPLSQFGPSLSIETNLPVTPEGFATVVLAVAKDTLGAVSRRLITNGNSSVTVINPFKDDVTAIDVVEIQQLVDDLLNTSDSVQVPNLCAAVSSALNDLDAETVQLAQEILGDSILTDVRKLCIVGVFDVVNDDNITLDADVVNIVASSVSSITASADQIDGNLLVDVDFETRGLIINMEDQVLDQARGLQDPIISSIIPDSFRQHIANTISNSLAASDLLFQNDDQISLDETLRVKNGRLLQPNDVADRCDVLKGIRDNLFDLSSLQTAFVPPGAPQIDVDATNVKFAAIKENVQDIGQFISDLDIPDANDGNNLISLPSNLAAELQRLNPGEESDLNVVAAKWSLQILCEERPVEELDCLDNYNYDGPREGLEGNIVSLDFLPFNNRGSSLDVAEISEPIVLLLDVPQSILDTLEINNIDGECNNETASANIDSRYFERTTTAAEETVCGFFNITDNDFVTDFCQTNSEIVFFKGVPKIECSCNHATDYAAWEAFRYDVLFTLREQIFLSELTILILFVCAPILVLLAIIFLIWAYVKDQRDSRNILRGAIARIKLQRIIKSRQKKRFFENVKKAQVETIMGVHDKQPEKISSFRYNDEEDGVGVTGLKPTAKYFCYQMYLALRYEHSFFGIKRYDPNFSRVQRVLIFLSVVICSFGAAAILFELRSEVYSISIAVVVLVSFGSAFMISIPIKLVARALFKGTENEVASKPDQVNSLYKIITRIETADGVESQTDYTLVEAISELHIAEIRLKKAISLESSSRDVSRRKSSNAFAEEVHLSELEQLPVADYAEAVLEARSYMSEASYEAREAWRAARYSSSMRGKFYSSWTKIKVIRAQSGNSVVKAVSLFSGTASRSAVPRESRLPRYVIWFDWLFLALILSFYSFYIVRFVGTRRERAETVVDELEFAPLTEQEYLIQWAIGAAGGIAISYVVAEPIISLLRYVLIPLFLLKCMKRNKLKKLVSTDLVDYKDDKDKSENTNIRDGKAHVGFELFADIVESFF